MSADRDRILEQALRHELRRDVAKTPDCLDAETLAAWQDGALDVARMSALESHVSTCAYCQALAGAFARGNTIVAAAEAPQAEGFRWWRWWLAPLAAGATAAVLWMVVPEEQQIATRPADKKAAITVDAIQRQAETVPQQPPASPATNEAGAAARGNLRDFDENKLKKDAREDRQQLKVQEALKEEAAADQIGQRAGTAALAATAPPAAAPMPPPAVAAPPPARPAAAQEARSENFAQPSELQKRAAAPLVPPIASSDGKVSWRINNQFVVRYENNSPIGTALYRLTDEQTITSGSSPNQSTLWLAGKAGLVLVSADAGTTFRNVSLAEPLDIASISAKDAGAAVISTVSGRRFQTDDGGRTWRPF